MSKTLNDHQQHLLLSDIINAQANAFERTLTQSLAATHILALEVRQQGGDIKDFEVISDEILKNVGGISNLQLAPNGIIQKIHPLEGNERAIGHNILVDDKRRDEALLAIEQHKLTLAGPFELIQGGIAVIGRNPVFLGEGLEQRFWGFTSALIFLEDLLDSTDLAQLETKGYRYELSRVSPETKQTETIAQSKGTLTSPSRSSIINVPNATWTLAVSRPDSSHAWLSFLGYAASITIAFASSWVMWFVLRQPEQLQKVVKQKTRELEQIALYDYLTGLANGRLLNMYLKHTIKQTSNGTQLAALLYCDLDDFKRINDSLGHEAGDNLLKQISERLTSVVGKDDVVARHGGDEFTILLSEYGTVEEIEAIANKLIEIISQPVVLGKKQFSVSASIGITMIPSDGLDVTTLIRNADMAMYAAKKDGKNNYCFFNSTLRDKAMHKASIEEGLSSAILNKQFVLHYQPIVDFSNDKICGYEALIRWNRPKEGLLYPDQFIGIAEESGKIIDIGYCVFREVCKVVKMRQQHTAESYRISVNLSPRQFTDVDLLDNIRQIIDEVGVEASYLEIEITESTLMENVEEAIDILHRLKELGVSVAIDDFGTGYSSLAMLKRLPVDKLKIDRSFVNEMDYNRSDQKIVQALISMAHTLQISVTGEGIETAEQLKLLKQYGCDYGQGYLFSKPVPIAQLENFT
ncbi:MULTISPECIES: EAL domain-containing protein [Vibrio]|uniref:bifunctional diguanylate cyclase/phosphodiesterase n=1 Tax=Vibrio TaxID=662 RepID=UPI001FCBB2DB|nr:MULTISPECIES: EAL domain-containing protein [Vibrio]